jgi:hypothetical protein
MPGTRFDVKGAVGKEVRLMLPLSFITSFWPSRWLESSNDAQLGRQMSAAARKTGRDDYLAASLRSQLARSNITRPATLLGLLHTERNWPALPSDLPLPMVCEEPCRKYGPLRL